MREDVRGRIKHFADRRQRACLARPFPGDPQLVAFILRVGDELVLTHPFHDFYPEGYTVIRIDEIRDVNRSDQEEYFESLILKECLFNIASYVFEIPMHNARECLEFLRRRSLVVTIECESPTWPDDDEYYIGRLQNCKTDHVIISCFNSLGIIDREPSIIYYSNITKISFDTPYGNMMSKHLRPDREKGGRGKGRRKEKGT